MLPAATCPYAGTETHWEVRMSWIGIVVVVVCLYLALKVAGFAMKLLMWGLVLFGLYWFLAPMVGWPALF